MIASSIWNQIGHPTLLVLGDLILDRYISGSCNRISPEAPVMVLQAEEEEDRLGGAAAVANLAKGLGANVLLAGVVGEDTASAKIRTLCATSGLQSSLALTDPNRPTTLKQRFLTRTTNGSIQHHLRVDTERTHPIAPSVEKEFLRQTQHQLDQIDAILLSDYGKGVLTDHLVQGIIETAFERGVPVLIDPARRKSFSKYHGATLITPNRTETEQAVGFSLRDKRRIISAGHLLRKQHQIQSVLITLDRDGLALITSDIEALAPTQPRTDCDVAGAGDMVLAVAGLGMAAKLPWPEVLSLANTAAGLEVERQGVVPVTRSEIQNGIGSSFSKVVTLDRLAALVEQYRAQKRGIVFTNGCFDLLHVGHLRCLEEAKSHGDILIVAVNSDESIRRLKGHPRPLVPAQERAALLAGFEYVNHVIVQADDTPHALLNRLQPDVLLKGGDYTPDEVVGREIVEEYGGRVILSSEIPDVSTSRILSQIFRRADDFHT